MFNLDDEEDEGIPHFDEAKCDAELKEDYAEIGRLNNELVGLESYRQTILQGGMSKSVGVGLEHLAPGVLNSLNLAMLTEAPSTNKMNFALESIDWRAKITKVAIVIVVLGIIIKMLGWIINMGKPGPSLNDSSAGRKIANNVSEERKKLFEEIKKEAEYIKQSKVAYAIEKMEPPDRWMRHCWKMIATMVRNKEIEDRKGVFMLHLITMYSAMEFPYVKDKDSALATLFQMMLKNRLRVDIGSLGFFIQFEDNYELEDLVRPPFVKTINRYTDLKVKLNTSVTTLDRVVTQGCDATEQVEREMRTTNDKSPDAMELHYQTIHSSIAGYYADLIECFEGIFGDGYKVPAFTFASGSLDSGKMGKFMNKKILYHREFDAAAAFAKEPQTYPGMPSAKYSPGSFVYAAYGRGTKDYTVYGSGGEQDWWDDKFNTTTTLGCFQLFTEGDDIPDMNLHPNSHKAMGWILRMLEEPRIMEDFIRVSDGRHNTLNAEFGPNGIKPIKEMLKKAKDLLGRLKEVEKKSKAGIPTVWDVQWKHAPGVHFHFGDTAENEGRIDSNFGEVAEHLLRATQAQLGAFIKTEVVFMKLSKKYLDFRSALAEVYL